MRLAFTALLLQGLIVATPAAAQQQDIIRTARAAGQFGTLLAAIDAAGLTSTLQGKGPFTVFAPTDGAFAKLPDGTVESLLKPENRDKLKAILLYHVVPGRVYAATARTLTNAATVEGRTIRIRADGNRLRINDATVVTADVGASNGVIHVIDQVLLPPENSAAGAMSSARRTSDALALLDLAINRGAPLFNDGQPAATSAIYEVASRAVLTLGTDVPSGARRVLERGLRDAARQHDLDERAWTLRRAIDDASRMLDGRMTMSARH